MVTFSKAGERDMTSDCTMLVRGAVTTPTAVASATALPPTSTATRPPATAIPPTPSRKWSRPDTYSGARYAHGDGLGGGHRYQDSDPNRDHAEADAAPAARIPDLFAGGQ